MAFIKIDENPYSAELVDLSKIENSTFNPRDYIDFSAFIRVKHDSLVSIADIGGSIVKEELAKRVMSNDIDRGTGELYEPKTASDNVSCLIFSKGDILFHKYAGRIGRIGIADIEGKADNHFMRIKPLKIDGHYLLLALRSLPVLLQLPYRETARPGVWKSDLDKVRIPRLGSLEAEIGSFVRRIFGLRKRAETVLANLLKSFDLAISSKMPTDYAFFMESETLSQETLDPGYYFMKAIEIMFPEHIVLGKEVHIIYPPSLNAGEEYTAVTLSDYRFEGIIPQKLKDVKQLWAKNYAKPNDMILNRLHSRGETIAKATVVLPRTDYLKETGLTLKHSDSVVEVPIYDQLFILKMKQSSKVSPFYLSVVFNSALFQNMFGFMMTGSTGRQRIRKTKLAVVRLPILSDYMMKAFSEATRISMEVLSETLRMLIQLYHLYQNVVYDKEKAQTLSSFITQEKDALVLLEGNSIESAEQLASEALNLEYEVRSPFFG